MLSEMRKGNCSDAALVLVGHGSTLNAESAAPTYQHADELRRRGIFAQVLECFWKIEPAICAVLRGVFARRVFVVPLFISEGYFTQEVIPRELGLPRKSSGEYERVLKRPLTLAEGIATSHLIGVPSPPPGERARVRGPIEQVIYYTAPIGTHDSMTRVLLSRAHDIVQKHPFPAAPKPKETALFIAGHGTPSNENSRQAIERQVELIRATGEFAEVHPAF